MIILHYHNVLDTGIEWSLAYDERYDGPISLYENSKNITIKYIEDDRISDRPGSKAQDDPER